MQLQGEGFILREPVPADKAAIAKYANNRKVWLNLRDRFPHPYTLKDAEDFIARKDNKENNSLRFAIDINGEFVGTIGIYPGTDVERVSAEIGYWLAEPYWGKGYMTKIVKVMVKYAFEQNKELMRIFAGVFEYNSASMRVLEKAGFTKEGIMRKAQVKDGKVINGHLYSITRDETGLL